MLTDRQAHHWPDFPTRAAEHHDDHATRWSEVSSAGAIALVLLAIQNTLLVVMSPLIKITLCPPLLPLPGLLRSLRYPGSKVGELLYHIRLTPDLRLHSALSGPQT